MYYEKESHDINNKTMKRSQNTVFSIVFARILGGAEAEHAIPSQRASSSLHAFLMAARSRVIWIRTGSYFHVGTQPM